MKTSSRSLLQGSGISSTPLHSRIHGRSPSPKISSARGSFGVFFHTKYPLLHCKNILKALLYMSDTGSSLHSLGTPRHPSSKTDDKRASQLGGSFAIISATQTNHVSQRIHCVLEKYSRSSRESRERTRLGGASMGKEEIASDNASISKADTTTNYLILRRMFTCRMHSSVE